MKRHAALLVIAASMILALRAEAQGAESLLLGVVLDDQGAGLPGVTVIARDETTGSSRTASTDRDGACAIGLKAGRYALTFQLTGFETFETTGVELRAGEETRVDTALEIAEVVEVIVVSPNLGGGTSPDRGGSVIWAEWTVEPQVLGWATKPTPSSCGYG